MKSILLFLLYLPIYFSTLVKLNEHNFAHIHNEINNGLAVSVIDKMNDFFCSSNDTFYIYISSGRGHVMSGERIIQSIRAYNEDYRDIRCIADYAFSMAFVIFQSCPIRYLMDHSILMQHQLQIEQNGPIENIMNRLNLTQQIYEKLVEMQSERLNISLVEFKELSMIGGCMALI